MRLRISLFLFGVVIAQGAPLSLSCGTVSGAHSGGGKVGVPYSGSLAASGGSPAYYFEITAGMLPSGLMFDPSTGTIHGTTTTPGTYPIGTAVVDSAGQVATASCTLYFAPAPGSKKK
jgi:hypothetical protein